MAVPFQARLRNLDNELSIIQNNNTIIIKDYSNYVANNDAENFYDLFDFKAIKITNYIGKEWLIGTYLVSSANQEIDVPYIQSFQGILPLETTFDFSDFGIGIFNVTLYVIPSYTETSYISDDCIVYIDKLYKCLDTTSDNPADAPTKWQEITDYDNLTSKYKATEQIYVDGLSSSLATESALDLGCDILNGLNQCSDICNNTDIQNMVKNCFTSYAEVLYDNSEYKMLNEVLNYNLVLNNCRNCN